MIEIKSKFDATMTENMNKAQLKKLGPFMFIVSGIFIILGLLMFLYFEEFEFSGIVFMVIGVLYIPLVKVLTKVFQKGINKSMTVLSSETIQYFRFEEKRVFIETVKGDLYKENVDADYSFLYKAVESKEGYMLYISRIQAFYIHKADFITGTSFELNTLLINNLGIKFKIYSGK
ncbi:MAG: hypothetical protein LBM99_03580 [Bacillales bacterium]|jgi:hypothetical protein|nr:hypothetical protein [Bacillales bacterium]